MASDREKMQLISNVRNNRLPAAAPKIEDAAMPETEPITMEGLEFQQLDFSWNPDGTLSKILVEQDAGSFTLNFAWNSNGTVSRITRQG
jgi:hypothetical protein